MIRVLGFTVWSVLLIAAGASLVLLGGFGVRVEHAALMNRTLKGTLLVYHIMMIVGSMLSTTNTMDDMIALLMFVLQ